MELKFAADQKPVKLDAPIIRRQKLVRRIDQQIGFVRDMIAGHEQRASWVWMDAEGIFYLPIKYGRRPIELKKGMFSIRCGNLDECEHALCTVRVQVLDGQFDDRLTKLATDIRTRFAKG